MIIMFTTIAILLLVIYIFLGLKRPGFAVITLPLVTVGMFFVCYVIAGNEPGDSEDGFYALIMMLLILPATILTILICQRGEKRDEWPWQFAKWMLIILLSLVLLFFALVISGPFIVYGFGFVVLMAGLFISFSLNQKHAVTTYVVSTIGASMRQNLPLAMALQSAAGEETDRRSRILRRISGWLVQGNSLSESIKLGFAKCPGNIKAMIAAAEKANQLPQVFKSIEEDMLQKAGERRRIKPIHPSYPIAVLSVLAFIVMGLMIFVIPKITMILKNMTEQPLPMATRILMSISCNVMFRYGWLTTIIILAALVIGLISLRTKYRPRRPEKPYLLSHINDFIKWHMPLIRWFEFNYSMAQTVELLRVSLNAGWTVNDAIGNTLSLDVNCFFRRRLVKWLARVEAGDNIAVAAKDVRLGSTLAWAFDAEVNQGNTPAVLEMLENFYRTNYSYRVKLVQFISEPCVTALTGVCVGFVVYAIFSPMVAIIRYMSDLVP